MVHTSGYGNTGADMRILVAVDFGTTYSALAYADTLNPKPRVIKKWGIGVLEGEKVPTIIQYKNGGTTGEFKWGFEIKDGEKRLDWFKLGLCPEQHSKSKLAEEYPSQTAYDSMDGETCERLVVDFLGRLRDRAVKFLEGKLGRTILESTTMEYIITVPAIWTDKAQNTTRRCAERAGMSNIRITSEPEAAGIFAMEELRNTIGVKFREGDTFVICDAGGGTVDLASYTVDAVKPPILKELVPGTGRLCGSTFLNRIFAKYLDERFEGCQYWNEDCKEVALKAFEDTIKRELTGEETDSRSIKIRGLPDMPRRGVKDGWLEIPLEDLKEKIFQPVMKDILELLDAQIKATREHANPRKLILAGGFGRNEYLRKRIQRSFGNNIEVMQLDESVTAIVQGALLKGFTDRAGKSSLPYWRVDSRAVRKSFGTLCLAKFDPKVHDKAHKQRYSFGEGDQVEIMRWFVKRGEIVPEKNPKPFKFSKQQWVCYGRPKSIECYLYVCENENPPRYEDSTVRKHAILKADISSIPEHALERETAANCHDFYDLEFQIEMTLRSASLKFVLIYRGKRYGPVEVEYL